MAEKKKSQKPDKKEVQKEIDKAIEELKEIKEDVKEIGVKKEELTDKKKENYLIWMFVFIVLAFVVFLGVWYYAGSLNKFSYAGVSWEKQKYSNSLTLYHSRFEVAPNVFYNAYFRFDPRKSNISLEGLDFKFNKKIFLSSDIDIGSCEDKVIAYPLLGDFFGGAFGRTVDGAIDNKSLAEQMNVPFADCSSAIDNQTTVLLVKRAEDSGELSIKQDASNKNCYILTVGKCGTLLTAERFIVGVIAQAHNIKI